MTALYGLAELLPVKKLCFMPSGAIGVLGISVRGLDRDDRVKIK